MATDDTEAQGMESEMNQDTGLTSTQWQKNAGDNVQTVIHQLLRERGRNLTEHGDEFASVAETGQRWVRALDEMTKGYAENPKEILAKRFGATYDEMVLLEGIAFNSLCEHHLMPFSGVAHVAYLPKDNVVGLSKLARLVECYAHRFQLQERLTEQIAKALMTELKPLGAACIIRAVHSCMACRGVKKTARMTTSCLLGRFREHGVLRAELLSMLNGK